MTGGGSGGHITPILAVAHELKKTAPDCEIIYIGQVGDALADIPASDNNIDRTFKVRAGKFRRYHGEGWRQIFDIKTLLLNTRDVAYVLLGTVQSYLLLRKLRPDIIFVKGGFVGVPVGLSAAVLRIPFITHDSDAIPGLANRIIAPWAALHTVAMATNIYPYEPTSTICVGIPIGKDYKHVTPELKAEYRHTLGMSMDDKVVLVVGGGLGAQRINNAVLDIAASLFRQTSSLRVIHGVGRANEGNARAMYNRRLTPATAERVVVKGYITDLHLYSGAADVIVTRAGATNLAEFSAQGKACIVVPSPFLTGGHQLKNAKILGDQHAVELVEESAMMANPELLAKAISHLLKSPQLAKALGDKLHDSAAHEQSAHALAGILLRQIQGRPDRV